MAKDISRARSTVLTLSYSQSYTSTFTQWILLDDSFSTRQRQIQSFKLTSQN